MKYGLLYSKKTKNIADDILSYASMKMLPRVDYLVDRDIPHAIDTINKEPVVMIFNGELLKNPYNWPPANNIFPIFISTYIKDINNAEFLDGLTKEYLNFYSPVGCEDETTFKILSKKGIKSYISNSMFMILQNIEIEQKDNKNIILVDTNKEIVNALAKYNCTELSFTVNEDLSNLTWEKRCDNVVEILKELKNAKYVITSNEDCVNICYALDIPVVFIHDKNKIMQYSANSYTTLSFINNIDTILDEITLDKENYTAMQKELELKIIEFIKKTENIDENDLILSNFTEQERANWQSYVAQSYTGNLFAMTQENIENIILNASREKVELYNTIATGNIAGSAKKAIKKILRF